MGDDSVYSKGLVYDDALPTAADNDEWRGARQTRHNERFNQPIGDWRYARAREQTLFVAHNATNDAATTLAGHVAPVLVDADDTMTKPFIFIRVPAAATKLVELDYIELECVVIGASGTEDNWADQLDTGATRWSSGGTALTIVNPNMQSSATSMFAGQTNHLLGGAVVSGAESASVR